MRIAFMGTPDFAVPALRSLYQAGHDIVAVYCQPPRPAGRGRKIQFCAVQQAAQSLNIPVFHPEKLKNQPDEMKRFQSLELDVAVVAAYGLILPEAILNTPKLGCLNIHASLLPRWRGASPIQSAIWAGDLETGVSIMKMDRGLDTGAVYLKDSLPITDTTTAQTLHDDLAALGSQLILRTLNHLQENNGFPATPQSENGMVYARQLNKEDGLINWNNTAKEIDRQIRALTPWPGTYTYLDGQLFKIISAKITPTLSDKPPGSLINSSLLISCGDHQALQLLEIQMAGKKRMTADEFLRGYTVKAGTVLG